MTSPSSSDTDILSAQREARQNFELSVGSTTHLLVLNPEIKREVIVSERVAVVVAVVRRGSKCPA